MHPTEATLRAYLDHELTGAAHAQTAAHLATCEDCQAHLLTLDVRAARVGQHLALLAPDAASTPRPPHLVYARWQAEYTPRSAGLESIGFTLQRSLIMLRSLFSGRYRLSLIHI